MGAEIVVDFGLFLLREGLLLVILIVSFSREFVKMSNIALCLVRKGLFETIFLVQNRKSKNLLIITRIDFIRSNRNLVKYSIIWCFNDFNCDFVCLSLNDRLVRYR